MTTTAARRRPLTLSAARSLVNECGDHFPRPLYPPPCFIDSPRLFPDSFSESVLVSVSTSLLLATFFVPFGLLSAHLTLYQSQKPSLRATCLTNSLLSLQFDPHVAIQTL